MIRPLPCRLLTVLLAATLLGTAGTHCDARADDNVFTVFHNLDTVEDEGERVRALRIPVYLTLRSWEDRPLGLRLRLAATFAAADLLDVLGQGPLKVRVLSFLPGVEFVFPLGRNHMLRPFVDLGIGTNDATNDVAALGALGLRTEFIFPSEAYVFGLEPGFRLSANAGGRAREESALSAHLTLTARRDLGFKIGGHPPDVGVYGEWGYDFQTLEFTSVQSQVDSRPRQYEIGLGVGFSHGRPKIGPFRVPRIRLGYRFGDLEGFRFRVGGDWLTTVSSERHPR